MTIGKTCLLYFFFFLISYSWSALSAQTPESDTSAINLLNSTSFDILKDDPDSARRLAFEAIKLSEPINYLRGISDGYVRLGLIEKNDGNYHEAIQLYKKSLGFRLKLGDQDLIARVYNNIGMAYSNLGQYDSAAYYLVKALKSAEEMGLKSAQAMYAMNLGIAYERNGDFEKSFQYNKTSRLLYESLEDSTGILKCIFNEATIYFNNNNFLKALPLYLEALELAEVLEDEHLKNLILSNLSITYMNLGKYVEAEKCLQQSMEYHSENENLQELAIDMSNLGILLQKMNKPDSAIYYLEASIKNCLIIDDIRTIVNSAQSLSDIYSEKNDFRRAYEYQKLYSTYNDTLFNESKAEAIADIQTRYETEKKENEIIVLNKDKEIQRQQLQRKTLIQFALVGGIASLALIFFLFFNRFKLKKKIESQEALLNERKRISSELHDDLGAQLSTARMFLSKLKNNQPEGDNIAIIDSSLNLIDGSINDLRRIMDDLQASTLQEKGIIAATEELVNKINHLQPINFTLTHYGLDERLHAKTEHQLFRITQELINNTLKYANARNVTIQFLARDEKVILLFEDDGKGFDPSKTKRGYGLSNIESRAGSMGGEVDFDSQPGKGSRTTIEMPLIYATAKT